MGSERLCTPRCSVGCTNVTGRYSHPQISSVTLRPFYRTVLEGICHAERQRLPSWGLAHPLLWNLLCSCEDKGGKARWRWGLRTAPVSWDSVRSNTGQVLSAQAVRPLSLQALAPGTEIECSLLMSRGSPPALTTVPCHHFLYHPAADSPQLARQQRETNSQVLT
jgi:hypothetical protein